jgi:hypothetical protein
MLSFAGSLVVTAVARSAALPGELSELAVGSFQPEVLVVLVV